eukprot:CAMPEP_0184479138 /NCGR_PEP_ID=MMETSP0113_2-20130426/976_1 /TAXON_ID=91329 /ORGANISM="Norrisiella sphaerica, Strain BC52" /LENGTH=305 /DNA_ID=CAMNT_0026857149 /DNA_START=200 /DNA_END=1117 /DNA_ORIENTATION=+
MAIINDAIYAATLAVMAAVAWNYDIANIIPGIDSLEANFKLTHGESDTRMLSWWPYFVTASIGYQLLITLGVKFMQNRPPSPLGKLLPLWSLIAWAFSFIATVRLASAVWEHIQRNEGSLYKTSLRYCDGVDELIESTVHKLSWVEFFCYSKPLEFIDTIFLVLKKKPVIRLHWIHHQLTMWYAWLCLVLFASPGIIFALINAFVHTVMYCWYFYASIKYKPASFAIMVTSIQNIQMLAGVFVPLYFFSIRSHCDIPDVYWFVTAAMYSLYVYLFGTLFVQKYIVAKACPKKKKKEKMNGFKAPH